MIRKIFGILLSLTFIFGTFAQGYAATEKTFSKPVVIEKTGRYRILSGRWEGSVSASKEKPRAVILVKSGFRGQIVLENVTVDVSGEGADYVCAMQIEPGAHPDIILKGRNVLKSGKFRAGIEVPVKAKVAIGSGSGGSLTAWGGYSAAGIGGGGGMSCGSVSLGEDVALEQNAGPRITASGGEGAAGIGGGRDGNGGVVTVCGGLTDAYGNGEAQDIGRGENGKAGKTAPQGGRLLRYDRVDWDTDDTEIRQEIMVRALNHDRPESICIHLEEPVTGDIYMKNILLPGRGAEIASYLYLPWNVRTVTFSYTVTETYKRQTYSYFEGNQTETKTEAIEMDSQTYNIDNIAGVSVVTIDPGTYWRYR